MENKFFGLKCSFEPMSMVNFRHASNKVVKEDKKSWVSREPNNGIWC